MTQMSRGYEDERLILQVFLAFVNRADRYGRFKELSLDHPGLENSRMSEADLRVLLICIQYHYDKEMLEEYILYDKSQNKGRGKYYRLKVQKDFQQFYLTVRIFRQNLITAEKYSRQQELTKSVFLYEMGIKPQTSDTRVSRMMRALPQHNMRL